MRSCCKVQGTVPGTSKPPVVHVSSCYLGICCVPSPGVGILPSHFNPHSSPVQSILFVPSEEMAAQG